MDDVTLPNCELARGRFFSHGGHLVVVVGGFLIVGGSWKVVLDGWWLVVMVRNPGEGMRQKMSGVAAAAVVLLCWQIMIRMID